MSTPKATTAYVSVPEKIPGFSTVGPKKKMPNSAKEFIKVIPFEDTEEEDEVVHGTPKLFDEEEGSTTVQTFQEKKATDQKKRKEACEETSIAKKQKQESSGQGHPTTQGQGSTITSLLKNPIISQKFGRHGRLTVRAEAFDRALGKENGFAIERLTAAKYRHSLYFSLEDLPRIIEGLECIKGGKKWERATRGCTIFMSDKDYQGVPVSPHPQIKRVYEATNKKFVLDLAMEEFEPLIQNLKELLGKIKEELQDGAP